MANQFHLIVISSDHEVVNEIKTVIQLFENGLTHFHLRKSDWTEVEMNSFLKFIPAVFHNRIVLHSNFKLAVTYKLKGIHLNEKSRSDIESFKNEKIISTSFHSLEAIEENKYPYEYIFLSPVFDSISKPEYISKFNLQSITDRLQLWRQENRRMPHVIALGGIDVKNILEVKRLGFAGAAVLGAIWESKDPIKAFKEIQSEFSQPAF